MRKAGLIASLCCAVALCFALVGCGAGGNDPQAAKEAFTGTWDLAGMTQNGQETSSSDLEMLQKLGLEVYLELNEDGTSKLMMFGESMEGTWEAENATTASLVLEGQKTEMSIEGDSMTMEQADSSLTFVKGEPRDEQSDAAEEGASASDGAKEASSGAASSAAASSASAKSASAKSASSSASAKAA